MRILLADDDLLFGKLLCLFARHMGHDVSLVADGTEALEAMSADDPPQMAILAYSLPGLAGPEVCRRLRSGGAAQRFLVLMTGNDDPDLERKVTSAGADAYLLKPVTANHLESLVRQAEASEAELRIA